MRAFNVMIAMFVSLIATSAAVADRANTISIVGSSTVYPFASKVAETFGESSGFTTPIIESTGSGGGMKLFCSGVMKKDHELFCWRTEDGHSYH